MRTPQHAFHSTIIRQKRRAQPSHIEILTANRADIDIVNHIRKTRRSSMNMGKSRSEGQRMEPSSFRALPVAYLLPCSFTARTQRAKDFLTLRLIFGIHRRAATPQLRNFNYEYGLRIGCTRTTTRIIDNPIISNHGCHWSTL